MWKCGCSWMAVSAEAPHLPGQISKLVPRWKTRISVSEDHADQTTPHRNTVFVQQRTLQWPLVYFSARKLLLQNCLSSSTWSPPHRPAASPAVSRPSAVSPTFPLPVFPLHIPAFSFLHGTPVAAAAAALSSSVTGIHTHVEDIPTLRPLLTPEGHFPAGFSAFCK